MSKVNHRIFITLLVIIVSAVLFLLTVNGLSYYKTGIEERVYAENHQALKPSGSVGHGLGIAGSLFMIIGMSSYMARKRFRFMSRMGLLKHWLEIHIFLCTLGPIMILFHTAFKFGGLVAVSFWSMVAVFLSGIAGRFIYIQIPRSIEGRMLTLNEIRELRTDIAGVLRQSNNLSNESFARITETIRKKAEIYHNSALRRFLSRRANDRSSVKMFSNELKSSGLPRSECKQLIRLVKDDISVNRKIERLDLMQRLFRYWHVAHLPFAMVMIIVMVIHVAVTIVFGYRWIF
jgi:hypothetical protein